MSELKLGDLTDRLAGIILAEIAGLGKKMETLFEKNIPSSEDILGSCVPKIELMHGMVQNYYQLSYKTILMEPKEDKEEQEGEVK